MIPCDAEGTNRETLSALVNQIAKYCQLAVLSDQESTSLTFRSDESLSALFPSTAMTGRVSGGVFNCIKQ